MNIRAAELAWYRENGKHRRRRIRLDANGAEYVIGDWSWNRDPKNLNRQEFCEPEMSFIL
jgi:hypothetical protein